MSEKIVVSMDYGAWRLLMNRPKRKTPSTAKCIAQ